jgi:hypothetical protein
MARRVLGNLCMDEKKPEKKDAAPQDKPGLEGEGSYSGTKKYDEEAERFAREEDIEKLGRKAREDVERDEASYRKAEEEGKSRMAEEDPELRR